MKTTPFYVYVARGLATFNAVMGIGLLAAWSKRSDEVQLWIPIVLLLISGASYLVLARHYIRGRRAKRVTSGSKNDRFGVT